MNRAQRRAQSAKSRAWRRGVETVHEEAAGLLELCVVRPDDLHLLLFDALAGYRRAGAIAPAVADAICDIGAAAATSSPKLCGSCPHELRDTQYSVVLAMPERDDPTTAIAMAICRTCATTDAAILEKATGAFRGIWPNLRPVTVTHKDGGRA